MQPVLFALLYKLHLQSVLVYAVHKEHAKLHAHLQDWRHVNPSYLQQAVKQKRQDILEVAK